MYLDFFGLSAAPFSIAPDPSFLYLTAKHQEALAHLLYSTTQKGGFILLTGEIGTGKTTLCRHFLKIVPEQYQTAFIFNPKISAQELLATICDEFGIVDIARPGGTASVKQLTDLINRRLLEIHAAGQNALLVIDEAQNLSLEVLEQIRLLTNLETTEQKLLQIILIGQPQLKTMLGREELRQLAQRIVARYHLEPLSVQETASYIRHRLVTSGCDQAAADAIFPVSTIREVCQRTQGVPRLINVLCDRALLGAYVENTHVVSRRIVRKAVLEVFGDEPTLRRPIFSGWRLGAIAASLALLAGGALWFLPPASWTAFPHALAGKPANPLATTGKETVPAAALGEGKEAAAYRSLLAQWDVPAEVANAISGEKAACQVANKYHLRCFSGTNKNWQQFQQYNRPAVLTLRDVDPRDQREFHAVIESVTDDQATLRVNGQAVTMKLRQLAFYWTGKFTLLWRPPTGYLTDSQLTPKALSGLMTAPPHWLFEQLGAGEGADVPIRQLVANFQRKAGIQDDGILGVQTLIMLSRSAGNGHVGPLLQAKR